MSLYRFSKSIDLWAIIEEQKSYLFSTINQKYNADLKNDFHGNQM
jgi:hypothetical protein